VISKVRVGIVGTSWWVEWMLAPSIGSHPKAEIAAICGRDQQRASEVAGRFDVPQIYAAYQEMLEAGSLDAVVVATPDDLHYPVTMAALDAGLHVLCEKPLALNADDARAMYEKAEAAGVRHMVNFTWRWLPEFQHLRHLIQEGYLGRPFHSHWQFQGGWGRTPAYGWRYDRERSNGMAGDLGSHMIDRARWCLGEISRVSAHLTTFVEREGPNGQLLDGTNDAASLLVDFQSGASGTIHVSSVAHVGNRSFEERVTLHGDQGTLEGGYAVGGQTAGAWLRGARGDEPELRPIPLPEHLVGSIASIKSFDDQLSTLFTSHPVSGRLFIDSIVSNQPASPGFYDGWRVQQVVDAALQSHQRGCWVEVETQ
jgi:predicted dehydrogenase